MATKPKLRIGKTEEGWTFTDQASGETWPLYDAEVDFSALVYKTDRKGAVLNDPRLCHISKSVVKHNKDIIAMWVFSGQETIILFAGKGRGDPYCLRYINGAKASKLRDTFDTRGAPETMMVSFLAPGAGNTLEKREERDKKRDRAAEKKRPTETKKPRQSRQRRLGVSPRPAPRISGRSMSHGATDEEAQEASEI